MVATRPWRWNHKDVARTAQGYVAKMSQVFVVALVSSRNDRHGEAGLLPLDCARVGPSWGG